MRKSEEISVIVPLYNKGAYIARALASIKNQNHPCHEIIVVDDGSTDRGSKIVRDLRAGDDRIRLFEQENGGPAAARNRGIQESRGSLVAFLDADDEWAPHFLELAVATLRNFPAAAAAAMAYRVVYPSGAARAAECRCGVPAGAQGIVRNYFQSLVRGAPPVWTSSVVVRGEVFQKLGGFPPLRRGEDTCLWNAIALSYPIAFANVVSSTFHLDADTAQRSSMRFLVVTEEDARLVLAPLDEALAGGQLPDEIAKAVRQYRRMRLGEMIRQNLMCGDAAGARRLYYTFWDGVLEDLLLEPRVPLYLAATYLPPSIPVKYWGMRHRVWSAIKR